MEERRTAPETSNPGERGRKPWVPPELQELPKLTDLTLQTGGAIPGGGNTNPPSTVF